MRVLFYGESPCIETGLGQVAKHHMETFQELEWQIEAVCINHGIDNYDREKYPFTIHKMRDINEPYNEQNMRDAILRGEYDVLFLSADCGNINKFSQLIAHQRGQRQFKTISYVPIDCDIINSEPFDCVAASDYAATYTYHSQDVFRRLLPNKHVKVIYLGCEPDVFYPIDGEERRKLRKELFDATDETFVVLFANRNQPRKDIARGMYAFHLFHTKYSDSLCYMHMKQNDVGGNIPGFAMIFDMKFGNRGKEIFFTTPNFSECYGIDRTAMNNVYNLADCYASSSTGEGWGLHTTEAMCAELPCVVPGNTANLDLIGTNEERGYFIECGGIDLWTMPYSFTANPRDIVSVSDMVSRLEHVYHNPMEAKLKAQEAREWCKQYTWYRFKEEWKKILVPLESSWNL